MPSAITSGLRRRRPVVVVLLTLTLLTIYLCYTRISIAMPLSEQGFHPSPPPEEAASPVETSEPQKEGDAAQKPISPMAYGTNSRPPFKDMTNIIGDLPDKFLPTSAAEDVDTDSKRKPRRLIIAGDIHGQKKSLEALLKKVSFDRHTDHLILTGDLLNKGPDSAGVVELAMELGASAVRGNHEDRVLLAHAAMHTPLVAGTSGDAPGALLNAIFGGDSTAPAAPDEADTLEQNPFSHGDFEDRETAASLSRAQLKWLAALPVILRVGDLAPALPNLLVVHAGLVPGVKLRKQDPWAVMNMRSLKYPFDEVRRERIRARLDRESARRRPRRPVTDELVDAEFRRQQTALARDRDRDREPGEDVAVPVEGRDGEAWAAAWNRHQAGLPEGERAAVVYGHDARTGLAIAKGQTWTFGLDSGCVYGRKLSALVVEVGKKGVVERKLVQIPCDKGTKD